MRTLFLIIFSFSMILFNGCKEEEKVVIQQTPPKDGAFIHISSGSNDVHRLLMGLQMAVKMSEDKDVLVYFDIKGIEAVLKDAKDFKFATFPSSKTQLTTLISKGITIMACPGCLKAAGKSEKDLMDGVKIADKEKFFSFTKGRILTIDY